MIGIATGPASGMWVLDPDVELEKGKDGEKTLATITETAGVEIPPTMTVRTPRGGRHIWFKWDPAHPVGCSDSALGPNLDTRGEGGYAILPPSVRSDGRAYRWEREHGLYACPPALLALMPKPGGRKAIDDLATSMMQGSPLSPADEAAAIGRRWRTL